MIFTSGCDKNPYQASHDFDKVRASIGTGRSSVLSQHIIQSFAPNEVTPEKALQIGIELCKRFLKEEYQYYLAVHIYSKYFTSDMKKKEITETIEKALEMYFLER